jgi:hypothetical protein
MSSTIELDDAIVTPAGGDPDAFFFAPKAPSIAVDPNGRRQLNVLTAGPVSFLQVTGAWGLNAAEVEALRGQLAGRLGRNPAALRLQPAPDAVTGVALLIGNGAGELAVLQQGRSSGVPPHHAVFNVMLDTAQLETAQEALGGKRGLLALRYDVVRRQPVTTTTAEHAAAHEVSGTREPGRSWSGVSAETTTKSTRETTEEITTTSVLLDAADWAG